MRSNSALRLLVGTASIATVLGLGVSTGTASAATRVPTATSTLTSSVTAKAAASGAAGTDYTITMPDATQGSRSYLLFVPSHLRSGLHSLVVALHYYSGSPALMEKTGLDVGAVTNGALVAYPQGVGSSFNSGTCCGIARDTNVDDVSFIDAVLNDVEARYSINPKQVAMGGFSNGGMMAYRYACERASRVQWFFVDAGVEVAPSCSFSRPINVLHLHGLLDATVPWDGTTTSTLFTGGVSPSVQPSVTQLMALDGCQGWTTTNTSTLVTKYVATGCPLGASYAMFTSSNMDHRWPHGPTDLATYGLDATTQTWNFLVNGWPKV